MGDARGEMPDTALTPATATAPAATTARGATPTPRSPAPRDRRIDALRGFFVVSMTTGHLAMATVLDRLTHPIRWVDGFSGFVLSSGLVLGIVLVRRPAAGPGSATRWLLRRAAVLAAAHVGLVVLAMLVRLATGRLGFVPTPAELGGLLPTAVGLVTLRVQPPFFTVLPLYVLLLGVAAPVVLAALRRGRTALVLAASAALYAVSQAAPYATVVADLAPGQTTVSPGAWQVLFVGGLVAGWHWRDTVRPWLARHRAAVVAASTAVVGAVVVLANGMEALPGLAGPWWPTVDALVGKDALRPGRVVLLAAAVVVGHVVLSALAGSLAAVVTRQLELIGSRSLECYLLLSVVQLAVFSLWPDRSTADSAVAVALTLAGMRWLATSGVRLR